jgi:hypothetical protein
VAIPNGDRSLSVAALLRLGLRLVSRVTTNLPQDTEQEAEVRPLWTMDASGSPGVRAAAGADDIQRRVGTAPPFQATERAQAVARRHKHRLDVSASLHLTRPMLYKRVTQALRPAVVGIRLRT